MNVYLFTIKYLPSDVEVSLMHRDSHQQQDLYCWIYRLD